MLTHNDWMLQMIAQEHHREMLREAEKSRLARLALSARTVLKTKKKLTIRQNAPCKPVEVLCCQTATI